MFPDPTGKWLLGKEEEAQQGTDPYPFMLRNAPFIPAARPTVRPGQPAKISLLTYNLSGGVPDSLGVLYAPDGTRVGEVELVLDEQEIGEDPSMTRYAATCMIPAIAAGTYRLEVTLRDPDSGDQQTASIDLRVEA